MWTPRERAAHAGSLRAAQAEAAANAEAAIETAIAEILEDDTISGPEKHRRLNLLSASGYSEAEFKMLQDARDSS